MTTTELSFGFCLLILSWPALNELARSNSIAMDEANKKVQFLLRSRDIQTTEPSIVMWLGFVGVPLAGINTGSWKWMRLLRNAMEYDTVVVSEVLDFLRRYGISLKNCSTKQRYAIIDNAFMSKNLAVVEMITRLCSLPVRRIVHLYWVLETNDLRFIRKMTEGMWHSPWVHEYYASILNPITTFSPEVLEYILSNINYTENDSKILRNIYVIDKIALMRPRLSIMRQIKKCNKITGSKLLTSTRLEDFVDNLVNTGDIELRSTQRVEALIAKHADMLLSHELFDSARDNAQRVATEKAAVDSLLAAIRELFESANAKLHEMH